MEKGGKREANQNPFSSWQRPVLTAVLWWKADNVISGQGVSSHLIAAPAHCEVKLLKMNSKRVIFLIHWSRSHMQQSLDLFRVPHAVASSSLLKVSSSLPFNAGLCEEIKWLEELRR